MPINQVYTSGNLRRRQNEFAVTKNELYFSLEKKKTHIGKNPIGKIVPRIVVL